MARSRAIIYSMTPAERSKPSLIDPKRKRRIAAGSGTKVEDVNRLLRQLEMAGGDGLQGFPGGAGRDGGTAASLQGPPAMSRTEGGNS